MDETATTGRVVRLGTRDPRCNTAIYLEGADEVGGRELPKLEWREAAHIPVRVDRDRQDGRQPEVLHDCYLTVT